MVFLWKDKEQQILSLFHKGKKEAMDKLYMEYADYLTGVCARYISEEDTLKDVLQESFIKVFTQIHQFEYRGKDSLKAWLTRIVINEALLQLRKNKNAFIPLQESIIADYPEEEPDVEGLDSDILFSSSNYHLAIEPFLISSSSKRKATRRLPRFFTSNQTPQLPSSQELKACWLK